MAMFVIAGRADCSRYARAEMLADRLAASLPHFRVHKASQYRAGYSRCLERDSGIRTPMKLWDTVCIPMRLDRKTVT